MSALPFKQAVHSGGGPLVVSGLEVALGSATALGLGLVRALAGAVETVVLTSDRLEAATALSLKQACATPYLSTIQYSGAAIILYAYSETDVMMLRLWTVSGLLCYSLVPNVVRGNVLLSAWACLFVGINAVRLVELASERAPVQLDDDRVERSKDVGRRGP